MHLPFKKLLTPFLLIAPISSFYSYAKTIEGSFLPQETTDSINKKYDNLYNDSNVNQYELSNQTNFNEIVNDIYSSKNCDNDCFVGKNDYIYPEKISNTLVILKNFNPDNSNGRIRYSAISGGGAGAQSNDIDENINTSNVNLAITGDVQNTKWLNGSTGSNGTGIQMNALYGNVYIIGEGSINGGENLGIMGTFADYSRKSQYGNVYIATDGNINLGDGNYGIIGSAAPHYIASDGSVYITKAKITITKSRYVKSAIAGVYGDSKATNGNVYISGENASTEINAPNIYGAYSIYDSSEKINALAKGNVSLFGSINIKGEDSSSYTDIYGGGSYIESSPGMEVKIDNYNVFNDNLFSIASNPITLGKVGNFKQYNFYVNQYNKDVINNSNKAILTVTDTIQNSDTFDNGEITQNKSIVKLVGISKDLAESVKQNDEITLIDASNVENFERTFEDEKTTKISDLFETENGSTSTVEVGLGGKAEVTYNIDNENKKISVTIDKYDAANKQVVNKNIKPLAEGRLATLENVVRSAESLQDVMGENKEVGTFTPIAEISGGINQYDGNTTIESRDYRLMVGSRYQILDNLYTGIALDYGLGNYDSDNGNKRGEGDIYNYGASIFGKYTNSIGLSDLYFDGALRAGRTSTEMQSNYVIPGSDKSINYKSKSNYFGINAGTGFIYNLNETSSFDTSVHYFWTHLGSDNVTVEGEEVYFKGANSSKAQLKEQYSYKTKNNLTFTLAGIYEYEFNSNSGASLSGTSVDAPNAKGSTKIIELGIKGTPIAESKDFNFNLKFRGYEGKRNGASASAFFEYNF